MFSDGENATEESVKQKDKMHLISLWIDLGVIKLKDYTLVLDLG